LCNCSGSPEAIETSLRCPPLPQDLVREAKRKPEVRGKTAFEVSAWLARQVRIKNAALYRANSLYNACRKT
jgi:hypothetical protein